MGGNDSPPPGTPPPGTPPMPFRPNMTKAPVYAAILTTFFIVSLLVFLARVYTRAKILRTFWWDDWLIVLTMVLAIVEYAMDMAIIPLGYGRHIEYIPPADILLTGKISYISLLIWVWTMTFLKTSMAMMLLRIKRTPGWKLGLWILTFSQLLSGISTSIIHFIRCFPVSAVWDPFLPGAKCWSKKGNLISYYVLSIYWVANDLIFALLPIAFIWCIRRPTREKVILLLLMGSGLFATFCAAIKINRLRIMVTTTDPFYDQVSIAIWAHLEEYIGIIAACIPCLRAPFEQALQKFGLLSAKDGTGYSSGYTDGYARRSDGRRTKSKSNPFGATTDSDVELIVDPETGRIRKAEDHISE